MRSPGRDTARSRTSRRAARGLASARAARQSRISWSRSLFTVSSPRSSRAARRRCRHPSTRSRVARSAHPSRPVAWCFPLIVVCRYTSNEMTLSRQEDSRTSGRTNQRARARAALVDAAVRLIRDGRPPSMPEVAELALVSVATAYRYFRTAEELWEDAALFNATELIDSDELEAAIEAAGDDVEARLEVVIRRLGWAFIDHELMTRQVMKASLDRWFAQQGTDTEPLSGSPGNAQQVERPRAGATAEHAGGSPGRRPHRRARLRPRRRGRDHPPRRPPPLPRLRQGTPAHDSAVDLARRPRRDRRGREAEDDKAASTHVIGATAGS